MSKAQMWSKNAEFVNGELHLAGIPASQLARDFGTPAFFLDEESFKSRAAAWREGLVRRVWQQCWPCFLCI
jgi:diaminopimelate decarboxylase